MLLDEDGHISLCNPVIYSHRLRIPDARDCILPASLEYAAPELLLHHKATQAVEWWMLGILLYEMVARSPPFTTRTLRSNSTKKESTKPCNFLRDFRRPPTRFLLHFSLKDPYNAWEQTGLPRSRATHSSMESIGRDCSNVNTQAPSSPTTTPAASLGLNPSSVVFPSAHSDDSPGAYYTSTGTTW